ncbi:hypothetical protein Droror1_Dr00013775 [Drosera rotundifolia]
MAVSSARFLPRKRRPPASSFLSPKLSGHDLLLALQSLSHSISALRPLRHLLRRSSASILRKCGLLSLLFDDLIRRPISAYSPSRQLCFEEMYIVLQRIKTLIEDCSAGSRTSLLMQIEPVAITFRELTSDLWTLLEILNDLRFGDDLEELKALIIKQCREDRSAAVVVDPEDDSLRIEVIGLLDSIRREIIPDHRRLEELFGKLGLSDSASCREEIERLEDEIQCLGDDRSKSDAIALIGVVRYAKCVLFGASISDADDAGRRVSAEEAVIPADFRCPITLDLMRDPVVVATGQTYDRSSIVLWIESGHSTCPKTGQTLAHSNLIPNLALKNLIAMWCRDQRIPYAAAEAKPTLMVNKAALEATKMTASFLVNKLQFATASSTEAVNGVVYELRALAKTDSDSRACIGEAGAVPLLAQHLGSEDPNLQVNAVTTLLNLSIHDANKTRIIETSGALAGIVGVLETGATWEAKGNAAATIFSLCGIHVYRKKIGKKTRVLRGLLTLAKEGPISSKKDALVAVLTLAIDRETVAKLVEEGVVEMVNVVADELPEEALAILEVVVKRGGCPGVAAAAFMVPRLAMILRDGTSRTREIAAATLVTICRKGGAEMVAELARVSMIEAMVWELINAGTGRAKRKATSLARILHRWAAGMKDEQHITEGYSMSVEVA